ncbi:MAG: hypothetical protein ACERKT_06800, partial [Acidobacteriota bacterium]
RPEPGYRLSGVGLIRAGLLAFVALPALLPAVAAFAAVLVLAALALLVDVAFRCVVLEADGDRVL